MGKKCKSKESIKTRSKRRRTLKKNRRNSESPRNTADEIQTSDPCTLSAEGVDGMTLNNYIL